MKQKYRTMQVISKSGIKSQHSAPFSGIDGANDIALHQLTHSGCLFLLTFNSFSQWLLNIVVKYLSEQIYCEEYHMNFYGEA